MTAICPSAGTSSARPGFAATVAMTVPAIGALLNNIPTAWAVPFAALLGLTSYELSTFCTIDPPTLPTLTASDFTDLLSLVDPVAHGVAQRKLQDFVSYYAWFQFCQCDTAPTPNPTSPQAQPTGMPAINPPGGGGSYPTGQPCGTYVFSGDQTDEDTLLHDTPIGAVTHVKTSWSASQTALTTNHTWGISLECYSSTNTFLGACGASMSSSGTFVSSLFAVPSGTHHIRVDTMSTNGVVSTFTWNAQFDLYCGLPSTGSGGSVPTPCVTDQFTTLMLQQILQLVTLIQRESVPFAYVTGPVHSGLTGTGTVNVQGTLGVLLNVSVPARSGLEVGTPDVRHDVGWVNFGTADGYTERVFISVDSQLVYPPVAGQFTLVGYSLDPGVSMTLTELQREP